MQQLFRNEFEEPGEKLSQQATGSVFFLLLVINEAVSGVLCSVLASPEQTGVQKGTTEHLGGWVHYASREAKRKHN